jgi:hypothetical protein
MCSPWPAPSSVKQYGTMVKRLGQQGVVPQLFLLLLYLYCNNRLKSLTLCEKGI